VVSICMTPPSGTHAARRAGPGSARGRDSLRRPPARRRHSHCPGWGQLTLAGRSFVCCLFVWHTVLGWPNFAVLRPAGWLRGRRGVRGGDSRLHCAVLPVVPLAGGRGSGYVARPPRKRAKTRQKPRTAPRCSVVSPCTGRNRASLRRSSEPLQASQARATLRRPAAPEDQSRRPRRTRLLPQERPRAEEAEVDVKMTPLSAETVRGS